MTSRKHTHVGHCQACGRTHAVNVKTGAIAKHGYTTRFGFFSGTCSGSDKLSLNVSRDFADEFIVRLGEYAAMQVQHAKALRAGTATPRNIVTDEYERTAENKWRRDINGNRIRVLIDFAAGTDSQKAAAVDNAIAECAREANGARDHAVELAALIVKLHGTPLIPVAGNAAADAPLAVGDTVRVGGAKGWDGIVTAIEFRECRGCGPHLNGQHLPHAIIARPEGGSYANPVRLIRKASIVKRAAK